MKIEIELFDKELLDKLEEFCYKYDINFITNPSTISELIELKLENNKLKEKIKSFYKK